MPQALPPRAASRRPLRGAAPARPTEAGPPAMAQTNAAAAARDSGGPPGKSGCEPCGARFRDAIAPARRFPGATPRRPARRCRRAPGRRSAGRNPHLPGTIRNWPRAAPRGGTPRRETAPRSRAATRSAARRRMPARPARPLPTRQAVAPRHMASNVPSMRSLRSRRQDFAGGEPRPAGLRRCQQPGQIVGRQFDIAIEHGQPFAAALANPAIDGLSEAGVAAHGETRGRRASRAASSARRRVSPLIHQPAIPPAGQHGLAPARLCRDRPLASGAERARSTAGTDWRRCQHRRLIGKTSSSPETPGSATRPATGSVSSLPNGTSTESKSRRNGCADGAEPRF